MVSVKIGHCSRVAVVLHVNVTAVPSLTNTRSAGLSESINSPWMTVDNIRSKQHVDCIFRIVQCKDVGYLNTRSRGLAEYSRLVRHRSHERDVFPAEYFRPVIGRMRSNVFPASYL